MTVAQIFGLDQSVIGESTFEAAFGGLLEGVCLGYSEECRVLHVVARVVRLGPGVLCTGGVFVEVTAPEPFLINHAGALPRYDRIVARRDNTTNTVWIGVKEGTPAAAPVPPSLTRSGGVYEISLAKVLVRAGAIMITAEDVMDERGEPSLCGYISFKAYEQVMRGMEEGFQQRGDWSAYAHAAALAGNLLWENTVSTDTSSAIITDADGIALQQDTNNVADTEAWSYAFIWCHRREYHSVVEFKFKLSSIADVRVFVGLAFDAPNCEFDLDPGPSAYAGLQFSTGRGDTTWHFVTKEQVIQTLVDTGIAADTNAHLLRVTCDEAVSQILIELFDTHHNIEASYTFTADLPPSAMRFYPTSGVRTLANAVKSIYQYYASGINRGI